MASEFDKLTREIYHKEPEIFVEVQNRFADILKDSYSVCPGPREESALKERLDIMAKWFQTFRRDLRWSRQRAFAHVKEALIAELRKEEYTPTREGKSTWGEVGPSQRLIWTPE